MKSLAKKALSPTELAVNEYLEGKGIKFNAFGRGATVLDEWECDAWAINMSRTKDSKVLGLQTDHHTGTGHRVLTSMGRMELSRAGKAAHGYRQSIIKQYSVAVAPCAASVLYCMLSDADYAEQNFHDWCNDLGYDNDSIKAMNTYHACCEILLKVRSFFTGPERQDLKTILEGY